MTKEEISTLSMEDVEARKAEIKKIVENKDDTTANFDELSTEVDLLEERKAVLIEEQRKADIIAVAEGAGEETEFKMEEKAMPTLQEVRSSKEYMDAYADYLKNDDARECRALLTDLVQDGVVPVPTFLEDEIKTFWDKSDLLSLVKKTYIKGILKVPFELSATGASVHTEGTSAPAEEEITFGIIEIKPEMIKKWISISDEVYAMKGEAFLRYIYDEITYRIAKKAEELVIGLIENAPTEISDSAVSVSTVEADVLTIGLFSEAIAQLSDKATNPVAVMNKQTWASFKAIQYAGNFNVDPFEGLTVLFNNNIKAYNAAEAGETYVIIGDFSGIQANFPEGDEITLKFDDITLAPQDLIRVIGRQYFGMNIVEDKFFTKITKEAES